MQLYRPLKAVYIIALCLPTLAANLRKQAEGVKRQSKTACYFLGLSVKIQRKSIQNYYDIGCKVSPSSYPSLFFSPRSLSASLSLFLRQVWYAGAAAELCVALSPGKNKVINVRRHGALMDRPINGGKNLAQGLMQMEARPVTSGVNMRTRSMGRG